MIILKEKQKERRLNQLKIKEISRLIRYKSLKPISDKTSTEDTETMSRLQRNKRIRHGSGRLDAK